MQNEALEKYKSRQRQAEKIITVINDFKGDDLYHWNCLDLGCSTGEIAHKLAPNFLRIIGIDLDFESIKTANINKSGNDEIYFIASGAHLPFPSKKFNCVICAQVYEHVSNQKALANEIFRILIPGGICFFSGPNRLALLEEHYWLPLLSWLPKYLANIYLRLFGRGKIYDPQPLLYWQLKDLWKQFIIHDYTNLMIQNPDRFNMNSSSSIGRFIHKIPGWIVKLFSPIYPNYNWILEKPESE